MTNWKPVLVDGKLNSELNVGDRVLVYEIPDEHFVGDKKRLISIATLRMFTKGHSDGSASYYWECDGLLDFEVTFGIEFSSRWAELPELPEVEK